MRAADGACALRGAGVGYVGASAAGLGRHVAHRSCQLAGGRPDPRNTTQTCREVGVALAACELEEMRALEVDLEGACCSARHHLEALRFK